MARRLGFPTTCCLVLNKRWHVAWRHTTPKLKRLLTQTCSQHPISDPSCALLTLSIPFLFATHRSCPPPLLLSCVTCQQLLANWLPITHKNAGQCARMKLRFAQTHQLLNPVLYDKFTAIFLPAVHDQTVDPPPCGAAVLQDSRPFPDNSQKRTLDSLQNLFTEKRSAQSYRPH